MATTVMETLARTVLKSATQPAMRFKDNGVWHEITWQDYQQTVRRFARGLCALGLAEKNFVTILSTNCKEWVLADVASIFAGAVPAGIYPTSSPDQCAYIINHCGATCAVVENTKQLSKLLGIRDQLKTLKFIVLIKGQSDEKDVYTWDKVLLKAEEFSDEQLEKRIRQQSASDLATLVYTSGTTANPKAVMLSHDNLTWVSDTCVKYDLTMTSKDMILSYLPLSHIAEQLTTIHGPMYAGTCVAFAESMDKMAQNLREIRPTLFLGVPRIWEKIQAKIVEKSAQASPLKRKIASWARGVGLRYGKDPNRYSKFSYQLADKLVFSKAREALGLDRCRLQVTAAAPIAKETLEFFMSLGITLYELYGMSESTGPVSVSTFEQFRFATTGRCIKGAELKIADDGEVLARGRHIFMGYLNDPKATQEVLDSDGWLHSGDIGVIDSDGYLSITGRKKNLIITAGGENIAPEMLEDKLKTIPEIDQAVVVGDRQKYLTALITLNPDSLRMIQGKQIASPAKNLEELAHCPNFRGYLNNKIESINGSVARVQTIKNFSILPNNFSEESGELTPTMKVKRGVVLKKYQSEIEAMYLN